MIHKTATARQSVNSCKMKQHPNTRLQPRIQMPFISYELKSLLTDRLTEDVLTAIFSSEFELIISLTAARIGSILHSCDLWGANIYTVVRKWLRTVHYRTDVDCPVNFLPTYSLLSPSYFHVWDLFFFHHPICTVVFALNIIVNK